MVITDITSRAEVIIIVQLQIHCMIGYISFYQKKFAKNCFYIKCHTKS